MISQYHDVWAYHFWKKRIPGRRRIWIRNNLSTLVSQLIDSVVFTLAAFLGQVPGSVLVEIVVTTYRAEGDGRGRRHSAGLPRESMASARSDSIRTTTRRAAEASCDGTLNWYQLSKDEAGRPVFVPDVRRSLAAERATAVEACSFFPTAQR